MFEIDNRKYLIAFGRGVNRSGLGYCPMDLGYLTRKKAISFLMTEHRHETVYGFAISNNAVEILPELKILGLKDTHVMMGKWGNRIMFIDKDHSSSEHWKYIFINSSNGFVDHLFGGDCDQCQYINTTTPPESAVDYIWEKRKLCGEVFEVLMLKKERNVVIIQNFFRMYLAQKKANILRCIPRNLFDNEFGEKRRQQLINENLWNREKTFKCDYECCKYKNSRSSDLVYHNRTQEKTFKCDYEGCEYKCSRSGTLICHKKTHTITGQIRRKKQENNLIKKLKEWGFSIDFETTINSKRGDCLADTNRYYSRLDYHVINCTNAILLIECDEDQHTWYELSCEFSRMSDVRASFVKTGYELPIYWIRYNPNGRYHVGSEQVKINRPEREEALKAKLEELCSSGFIPDKQVNIHYMFYDLISEELGPEIMGESDFPEYLHECVSWY